MKSDEQFLEEVSFLYDSIASTHPDLLGAYESFVEAGEAFLAEAEGKADPGRLDRLRQTYERAKTRTKAYFMTQVRNLKALDNVLRAWRSPGRDYQRHVDQARAAHSEYVNAMNESSAEIDRIGLAVEDFDTRRR
jgi:hypothetical protein